MKHHYVFLFLFIFCLVPSTHIQAQKKIDSTQIGKEYPYILPFLGKKAYAKGYSLQKPFGVMAGYIFNKQEIVLKDFEMSILNDEGNQTEFFSLDGILDFGPSEGRIHTGNVRVDAWLLPFLSVGGYYGQIKGEQTISFSLLGGDKFYESVTDIDGKYYGLNVLGVVPAGPVNLILDYSWSWTTNDRLDKPVRVEVGGARVVRAIQFNKKDRFIGVWIGAQFQKLDNQTSGSIGFDEALGITEEDKQELDNQWNSFKNNETPNGDGLYWDDLTVFEKLKYEATYELVTGVADSTVLYKFIKELKYDWNMLLGFNYQHNTTWQFRAEYGFLKSKQQIMLGLNYRFGF